MQTLAAASLLGAAIVLILYVDSLAAASLYARPRRLFLIPPLFLYWSGRMQFMVHRRLMGYDPVSFVLRDKISLLVASLATVLVIMAI